MLVNNEQANFHRSSSWKINLVVTRYDREYRYPRFCTLLRKEMPILDFFCELAYQELGKEAKKEAKNGRTEDAAAALDRLVIEVDID